MKYLILVLFFSTLNACVLIPKFETRNGCEGVIRNGQKEGRWVCTNPETKRIAMIGEFAEGKKDGKLEVFYPTGETESISHWRKGLFHGNFKSYYPNGQRQYEMYYTNGNRSDWYYEWNSKGEEINE